MLYSVFLFNSHSNLLHTYLLCCKMCAQICSNIQREAKNMLLVILVLLCEFVGHSSTHMQTKTNLHAMGKNKAHLLCTHLSMHALKTSSMMTNIPLRRTACCRETVATEEDKEDNLY